MSHAALLLLLLLLLLHSLREPAKLVAKLRELKTDKHLLLFKCEMGAGHFSVTGR
jgi:protease II